MKKNQIIKSATILGGGIAFNILFWDEILGFNLMLFSILLLILGFLFYPSVKSSKPALISASGVLITALMVVYHNSFAAKFTNITSIIVFIGFLNQNELKAIFHALPTGIMNFVKTPLALWDMFSLFFKSDKNAVKHMRTLKVIAIPLLFFITFYVIFHYSNPVFADYSIRFWTAIGDWFSNVFLHISFAWIFLLLFGMIIIAWVIFQSDIKYFLKIEKGCSQTISREEMKLKKNRTYSTFKNLDLKNEYRSALYLIVSINILLLIINAIDINWLWFNFQYDATMNLSKFVHEGTYLLILSILLSIGILLYFFRKNLNFYFKKKTLALLATIWICQNFILVISVGIRNYRYIYHYGLAYKRIGVIIFLIATLIGLITLYIKINKSKSSYYLLSVNSWCVYVLLIGMSVVNWDLLIVKHNIKHTTKENIDINFLLSLSDKSLPVIYENRNNYMMEMKMATGYERSLEELLDHRIKCFMNRMENTTWKSWNYADQQAYDYFKRIEK